jgi:twitching motility protein PilI
MTGTASGPFQLLLETASRARSGAESAETRLRIQPHWTGVGFSLMGCNLVAPMGEVTEILMLPPLTRLPRVQPWVRGVANVRGRLMPVIGLADWFGARATPGWRSHRALVVEAGEVYCGLVVDEVFGLKHFAADARGGPPQGVPEALAPFVSTGFATLEGEWGVFEAARLVADPRFLDAAL